MISGVEGELNMASHHEPLDGSGPPPEITVDGTLDVPGQMYFSFVEPFCLYTIPGMVKYIAEFCGEYHGESHGEVRRDWTVKHKFTTHLDTDRGYYGD